MRTLFGWLRDIWLTIGVILALVLALEHGPSLARSAWRLVTTGEAAKPHFQAQADGYNGAAWAGDYYREYWANSVGEWRPYVQWHHRPDIDGKFVTFDERGLRRTWRDPKLSGAQRPLRVFFFGGSTMMGAGARDEHTIPSEVAKRLSQITGQAVDAVNFGQNGYNVTQATLRLMLALREGERPDVVVFYDGVNEIIAADQAGRAGVPMNEADRLREFGLILPQRRGDLFAETARAVFPGTMRLAEDSAAWLGLAEPERQTRTDAQRQDLATAIVGTYAATIQQVRALGQEYGFRPVFFWQPIIFTKPTLTEYERTYMLKGVRDPELFKATYATRAGSGHPWGAWNAHDLQGVFATTAEGVYTDYCHLSENGNAIIAEAMIPHLRSLLRTAASRGATP